jgi:ParB family transcriptional regulator, chromosome partitioning protein
MQIVNLPLSHLKEAPWNANIMDLAMQARLRESIRRYGILENLVVRKIENSSFEVLSGNQRLAALRDTGYFEAPCMIVELDDARARLLAQALNHIRGEDDIGLRAELLQTVLKSMPESEILTILPDTAESLNALASLGQEAIADYLKKFQEAQTTRLKHLQFKLTSVQLEVVQEALARIYPHVGSADKENPNFRSIALFLLCKGYLEKEEQA